MEPDEESRLYAEREAALLRESCQVEMPTPVPDTLPTPPVIPCADPTERDVDVFLPPNILPDPPPGPRLLPLALHVSNRARTATCATGAVGADGGISTYTVSEGTDGDGSSDVFLSDIEGITQTELYRLAARVTAMQVYITANLKALAATIDAAPGNAVALKLAFSEGLATAMISPVSQATLVTAVLVVTQSTEDAIADALALSHLNCVYESDEFWMICSAASSDGFVKEDELPVPATGYTHYPEGYATSVVSKVDANAIATRSAMRDLACLIPNTEQTATCTNADIEDFAGQEFWVIDDIIESGADAEKRKVVYTSTVAAGTYFAHTLATANEIAMSAAQAGLNCFFPSETVARSCATQNTDAIHRVLDMSYTEDQILNEMATGSSATSRLALMPDNEGILTSPALAVDDRMALKSVMPIGSFVSEVSVAAANALASSYADMLLSCFWVSPMHDCSCLPLNPEEIPLTTYPHTPSSVLVYAGGVEAMSHKFPGKAMNVELVSPAAGNYQLLEQGRFTSVTFPGQDDFNGADVWREQLESICHASLACVFEAWDVAYCEPKDDARTTMENGEPNKIFIEDGGVYLTQYAAHEIWRAQLKSPDPEMHPSIMNVDEIGWDAYDVDPEEYGLPGGKMDNLLNGWFYSCKRQHGTPAALEYGGVLKYGKTWLRPVLKQTSIDPEVWVYDYAAMQAMLNGDNYGAEGKVQYQLPIITQDLGDPSGLSDERVTHYSGAEGYAIGDNPITVAVDAKLSAIALMDCTHMQFNRHMERCPGLGQYQLVPINDFTLMESQSTAQSNENAETLLLSKMNCQEGTPFKLAVVDGVDGNNNPEKKLNIGNPSLVFLTKGNCPGAVTGLCRIPLSFSDSGSPALAPGDIPAKSAHYFVVAQCPNDDYHVGCTHPNCQPGYTHNIVCITNNAR